MDNLFSDCPCLSGLTCHSEIQNMQMIKTQRLQNDTTNKAYDEEPIEIQSHNGL